nr:hypothetical protein [Stappia indica]
MFIFKRLKINLFQITRRYHTHITERQITIVMMTITKRRNFAVFGGIVVSTPILHLFAGIRNGVEPMDVEAFRLELAIEGFDEAIVRWFARPREVECDIVRTRPEINVAGGELVPVVDRDRLGIADLAAHPFQRLDHLLAAVGEPGIRRRTITHLPKVRVSS